MSEQQLDFDEKNDILYIPGFLLKMTPKGATARNDVENEEDDFLKNAKAWTECNFTDDCLE